MACIFESLRTLAGLPELDGIQEKERFALFALHPRGRVKEGWINMHLLLWKHIIALLVKIEEEGEVYAVHKIWAPTWIRFERKVLALKEKVDIEIRRSEARGEQIRDMSRKSRPMEPLASFTEAGELQWNAELVKRVKELGKLTKGGGTGGRQ